MTVSLTNTLAAEFWTVYNEAVWCLFTKKNVLSYHLQKKQCKFKSKGFQF